MLKWLKGIAKLECSGVDITIIHHIKSSSEMMQDGERMEGEEVQTLR